MKTNTEALEGLTARINRLEEQRRAAGAEAERAAKMLEELNARRTTLVPDASSDESGAARALGDLVAALDEEAAALSRTKALAEAAARELDRRLLEVGVRRHEEEKRFARRRYEALCEERYSLDGEAEEAMASLVEVLYRLEDLHADQVRAAADADNSYLAQQDPRDTIENWLARRLRRWLPLGSLEKYDASLPELDPLALRPERGEEAF